MDVDNKVKTFVFYINNIESKSVLDESTKSKRYIIGGHITTEDLDLVNDVVTKNCMRSISEQAKSRVLKLDFDHETLRGVTDIDEKLSLTKIPLGKTISETIDEKGNYLEFELNSNWKKFDEKGNVTMSFSELWDCVEKKFYDSFSIAFVPMKTTMKNINGINARFLDDIKMINIALTGNPINMGADASFVKVMAKSLDFITKKGDAKMAEDDDEKKKKKKEDDEAAEKESAKKEKEEMKKEAKSMMDAITDMKSQVAEIAVLKTAIAEIPTLKSKIAELEKQAVDTKTILEKARNSSTFEGSAAKSAANDNSNKGTIKGPLDMI